MDDFKNIMEQRKQMLLKFIKDDEYKPMKSSDIAYILQVEPSDRKFFDQILTDLEKDGSLMITKRGKVMPAEALSLIRGTFSATERNFGFVVPENSQGSDIFIESAATNGAMNKDTVLCRIIHPGGGGKRPEGEIIKIVKRGINSIVGTFIKEGRLPTSPVRTGSKGSSANAGRVKHYFVRPDDRKLRQDIYIPKKEAGNFISGSKVVVKITKPSDREGRNPEGKIIEVLGHINEPGVDILSIVKQFEIPTEFSEKAKSEALAAPQTVSAAEMEGRLDLRHLQTVTIDSDDALDLDDAISIEKIDIGYQLGVHIADVNHYVKEGGILDREARRRGTSVYLADRVIPMLPKELSNGICSLNPQEDRLTLSCIMDIDGEGNVVSHKIAETVIWIDKRCSYAGVSAVLDEHIEIGEYADFVDMFKLMQDLQKILKSKRKKRGAIEFDFPECKVKLDENGKPIGVESRVRNIASQIIEEFMLICNETVAEEYFWLEAPFVYRCHEEPDSEKIENLAEFIRHFGLFIKGKSNHPKNFQQLVDEIKDKPEEMIISKALLRSLKQARYSDENNGHFGLASKYYCHFTSPIRRYPDLQIHRIIKDNLNGRLGDKEERYKRILADVAKFSSMAERTAEEAEREVENLKKVEFMSGKEGQVFDGIISSVTRFGIFVELPNTVEGLVSYGHIEDDYYIYNEKLMEAKGEQSGKIYRPGHKVRVRLLNADLQNRRLDFVFNV
ncbi:MAG: ribonuclease R [Defluviitaleaceae bacterium]|nr:ribonuclease R [Defluviitaleaceae bacterium]